MAYENYDVTGLPAYVNQEADPIVRDVIFGNKLAQRVRIQLGVKGKAAINILDADPTLQVNACGFNPASDDVLTQRVIETADLKVDDEICVKNLVGTYAEYLVRIGAEERKEFPFEAYLMSSLIAKIKNKTEILMWQGDTTSLDTLLKLYDGLLVTAAADLAAGNKVSISAGTSVYAGLLQMVAKFTDEMLSKGAEIYVSPQIHMLLQQELVNMNLYHYPVEPSDEIFLPGLPVKVVAMYGLKGSLVALATYPDNLVYGTDVRDADEQVAVEYDRFAQVFKVHIEWNGGINFAFPEDVVTGTFASLPTAGSPSVVALNAIAAGVAGLADDVAELADDDHVFKTKEQA